MNIFYSIFNLIGAKECQISKTKKGIFGLYVYYYSLALYKNEFSVVKVFDFKNGNKLVTFDPLYNFLLYPRIRQLCSRNKEPMIKLTSIIKRAETDFFISIKEQIINDCLDKAYEPQFAFSSRLYINFILSILMLIALFVMNITLYSRVGLTSFFMLFTLVDLIMFFIISLSIVAEPLLLCIKRVYS